MSMDERIEEALEGTDLEAYPTPEINGLVVYSRGAKGHPTYFEVELSPEDPDNPDVEQLVEDALRVIEALKEILG